MAKFTAEQIEQVVTNILILDGPDGHADGAEIITRFIIAVSKNETEKWIREYESTFELKQNRFNFHCVQKIYE